MRDKRWRGRQRPSQLTNSSSRRLGPETCKQEQVTTRLDYLCDSCIHPWRVHAGLDVCLHYLAVDNWMWVLESLGGVQLRQEDTLQPGKLDRPLRKLSGAGIGLESWAVEPGVCACECVRDAILLNGRRPRE